MALGELLEWVVQKAPPSPTAQTCTNGAALDHIGCRRRVLLAHWYTGWMWVCSVCIFTSWGIEESWALCPC